MKNAVPGVGLKPMTFVTLVAAHRAIHLRRIELRTWQKLAGFY